MSESDDISLTKLKVFINPDEPKPRLNTSQIPQLSCVNTNYTEKPQILDVAYPQVANCKARDFRDNVTVVVDLHDSQAFFSNLAFVEVEKLNDSLALSFEVNFPFTTWKHSLNILSYAEKLRDRIYDDHGVTSSQDNLFEENLLHLKFPVHADSEDTFAFVCEKFSQSLALAHDYILSSHELHEQTSREIEIPQGYTQPAHLILNFLVTIMKRRLPNIDIRQTTVTSVDKSFLRITFPRSVTQTIDSILAEYSEVITGCMNPDCFFASPSVMSAFLSRLKMAREEMSLVLSVSAKQANQAFLDNEMQVLKAHLSKAIDSSIGRESAAMRKQAIFSDQASPELLA